MSENSQRLLRLLNDAAASGRLRRLIGSRPFGEGSQKATATLCLFRGEAVLAVEESFPDGKVKHSRLSLPLSEEAFGPIFGRFAQLNVLTELGDAEYKKSAKGRDILRMKEGLTASLSGAGITLPKEELQRKKNHILKGDEPFLRELEIADKDGRIHDKKQPKFRQINRFLEHLREVIPYLPREGPLSVYDLCCGKSYLSFAVYHYLSVTLGRPVDMLCLDLKRDVMEFCAESASRLGFSGMRFITEDVRRTPSGTPHLVMSLHACDIATDLVLSKGIELAAPVILSTPCCHRTLSRFLSCPPLSFASGQPQLRQKLSEALTDGLRALRLTAAGYRVTATELTDPDDTPKNTLLRAVRREGPDKEGVALSAQKEYEEALLYLFGDKKQDYLNAIQ